MSGNLVELTDSNFDAEALKADKPVLVDFWAPWCAPCRMVGPIVEELAGNYSGKLKVGKLNTDDNPDVASRYGIMSIPTILLFKNGEIADRIVGAVPKKEFEKMLAKHV
jgi:thioredoxin 1